MLRFAGCVSAPPLCAAAVAFTPCEELVAGLGFANVSTILATVATLMGTGAVVSRRLCKNAIEAAIVDACHSGQGGAAIVTIAFIVMR